MLAKTSISTFCMCLSVLCFPASLLLAPPLCVLGHFLNWCVIYNVVLVSCVQQRDSVTHKYVYSFSDFSMIGIMRYWVHSLCYTVRPCHLSVSHIVVSVQFSQSCLTLLDPMDLSTPGIPVHHQLPEFAQTHAHWVGDATQPSHPLYPSPPAFNLSQHQGLFQWVSSLHQVAKVLEFLLQHQSFQWTPRTDLL